jgi:hypothetical protein
VPSLGVAHYTYTSIRSRSRNTSIISKDVARIQTVGDSLTTQVSRKEQPADQLRDMPPAGGYETIKYKRSLPTRGPGGIAIFGAVFGICALGFWRVGAGNLEKR